MVTIELPIRPHVNQRKIIEATARFNVFACGRRFGKTDGAKVKVIMKAPTQRIWWLAPTYPMTIQVWRQFARIFRDFPGVYINSADRYIEFPTGGNLAVKSTHAPDNLRGAGLDYAVLDEAAFMAEDVWSKVVRPMLLESEGSADFLSSPNGRNWFWQIYQLGSDPNEPLWESYHFTSYDNPRISPAEIEDIKRNTPERVFQQEYLAEFLADGGAVFRNITACIGDLPTVARGHTILGCDWARYNDYTVFYVIDAATRKVLDYDRFNQIDWTMQRDRLLTMARKWNVKEVIAEANSIGEPNIEELQKTGLQVTGFTTTSASKQQIINALALAFEQTDITIPNDPVLIGELQAYTLERLPSGTFRYSAPSGLHDDCVMALALAWYGVTKPQARYIEMPDWFFDDTGHAV